MPTKASAQKLTSVNRRYRPRCCREASITNRPMTSINDHASLDSQGRVQYGVSQGAFATLSLKTRCPDFRNEMQHWQPAPTAQQQRIHINLQVQTHRRQQSPSFTQARATGQSGLRRWCLPITAVSPPRHTRAGCIHRSFRLHTIVAALVCRSSHSAKNSDLAARVGRRAINFLVITRAESSIQLIEGADLLMC